MDLFSTVSASIIINMLIYYMTIMSQEDKINAEQIIF